MLPVLLISKKLIGFGIQFTLGQIVNTINGRLARWMVVLETSISKCEKLYYVNSLFAFFPTEIKFKSDNITFTEVSL